MAHHISKEGISPANKELFDLLLHGDDFLKIELLRPAKNYYQRALGLDPTNREIRSKIEQCNKMLAFERKVIWILLGITVALVIGYSLIKA